MVPRTGGVRESLLQVVPGCRLKPGFVRQIPYESYAESRVLTRPCSSMPKSHKRLIPDCARYGRISTLMPSKQVLPQKLGDLCAPIANVR